MGFALNNNATHLLVQPRSELITQEPSSIHGLSDGPVGSAATELNVSLTFNQSAYLPGSQINATYTLHNNFTESLDNVNYTLNISELILISGELDENIPTLGANASYTRSIICELPENSQSLDVVFLIDGSGSMGEELDEVKLEILNLIDSLSEQVAVLRIGFLIFGSIKLS